MNVIQRKLMNYHHGIFMTIGLISFLAGFTLQVSKSPETLTLESYQVLTVIGALILGWGTGRCDQKACQA